MYTQPKINILNGLYSGSDLRRANYKAKFPLPLKLSSRCHRCTTCWKVFCILEIVINVKVSKFQNEFIESLFLPKYEPNIVRISALYCATLQGRNPYNFWFIFSEKQWLHEFIPKFTDLYLVKFQRLITWWNVFLLDHNY